MARHAESLLLDFLQEWSFYTPSIPTYILPPPVDLNWRNTRVSNYAGVSFFEIVAAL